MIELDDIDQGLHNGEFFLEYQSGLLDVAGQIILEITEKGIPDRLGLEALNSANRRTGVRIALDDVTLSGANLALLSRFGVHFINIDRVLIKELEDPGSGVRWLDGLSTLLRSTPLQVIAEGVETPEQLGHLKAAGIPLAQGFFLSRPLTAEGFKAFFTAKTPLLQPSRHRLRPGSVIRHRRVEVVTPSVHSRCGCGGAIESATEHQAAC